MTQPPGGTGPEPDEPPPWPQEPPEPQVPQAPPGEPEAPLSEPGAPRDRPAPAPGHPVAGQPPPPGEPPPPGPPPSPPPPGQPHQQRPPAGPGYNILAILALVFAFVFAPAGIVLGHVAKRQIAQSGEQGDGLATAGLVLGYVFTGLALLACCVGVIAAVLAGGAQSG